MKRIIFIFLIFATVILYPRQKWEWQNPLPQGNILNDIQAVNSLTGYACGNDGTVLKTTDGGSNWKLLNFPSHADLTSIQFINEEEGWVAGEKKAWIAGAENDSAFIYGTSDGGTTWNPVFSGKGSGTSMFFLDKNNGWISIDSILYSIKLTGLISSPVIKIHNSISSVFFLNSSLGWFTARNLIYKTTDGGGSWSPDTAESSLFSNLTKIRFTDDSVGYLIEKETGPNVLKGYLLKSTDGGDSWVEQLSIGIPLAQYITFTDLDVYNDKIAWASAEGRIFKTNDGKNWDQISDIEGLYNLTVVDSSTLWGAGNFGMLYLSTDGGRTWRKSYGGYIFQSNDIQALNDKDIFAAGGETFLKSTDGGASWDSINTVNISQTSFNIRSVGFVDSLKGWIGVDMGMTGKIYATTDGGSSWTLQKDSMNSILDIFFINKNTGWFFSGSHAYRTTDSGNSWNIQTGKMPDAQIETLYFVSPEIGFAGGYLGLYKTSDGGENWTKINLTIPDPYVKSIYFKNSKFGWATGYSGNTGYVLRTTDGGSNWISSTVPQVSFTVWPQSICFTDSNNGWVVGLGTPGGGFACHTSNGGADWTPVKVSCNSALYRVVFPDSTDGWIMGGMGEIIHMRNNGVTLVKTDRITVPVKFELFQNYPNPFNPSTMIKYRLSVPGNVTLKIYDILGNELATLVDSYESKGDYSVNFNAGNLASGVYFYKLRTAASSGKIQVSVKKMMVLK